jgi:hypothetical protein
MDYGEDDSPHQSAATVKIPADLSEIRSTVEDMTASKEPIFRH